MNKGGAWAYTVGYSDHFEPCKKNRSCINGIIIVIMISFCRSSSVICNPGLSAPGVEVMPSLPGLFCSRLMTSSTIAGPNSPLSLPTALLYLLNTITSIHKGLIQKVNSLWLNCFIDLKKCCVFCLIRGKFLSLSLISSVVSSSLTLYWVICGLVSEPCPLFLTWAPGFYAMSTTCCIYCSDWLTSW